MLPHEPKNSLIFSRHSTMRVTADLLPCSSFWRVVMCPPSDSSLSMFKVSTRAENVYGVQLIDRLLDQRRVVGGARRGRDEQQADGEGERSRAWHGLLLGRLRMRVTSMRVTLKGCRRMCDTRRPRSRPERPRAAQGSVAATGGAATMGARRGWGRVAGGQAAPSERGTVRAPRRGPVNITPEPSTERRAVRAR